MKFFWKLKCWCKRNLSDRYLVISGPNGNTSIHFGLLAQVFLLILLTIFLVCTFLIVKDFFNRKRSIDIVYIKMDELRSANKDLIDKVKLIDEDLSIFSDYMSNNKSKKKSQSNRWSELNGKEIKDRSQMALSILNDGLFDFVHNVNARMGFLITRITGMGVDPYKFLKEPKSKLDKVRLSNIKIPSNKLLPIDVYHRRSNYYYYKPSFLNLSNGASSFTGSSIRKVIPVLKTLESIFAALPINVPMSGKFIITSRYGIRSDPFSKGKRMHSGVDLVRYDGADILASGSGIVAFAGFKGGYGYTVDINHGYGLKSRYAHMKGVSVNIGDKVKANQVVGYQGKTGSRCRGSHLHYEVHYGNKTINPLHYIYAGKTIRQDQIAYFQR